MPDQPNFAAGLGITVAGGGISGLAAAAAFAQRGASVAVHEQAPELHEVGAGLQISPNGVAVLDALGLGAAVREAGVALERIELKDGMTGRTVHAMSLAGTPRPYLALHRADLIGLLEQAARRAGAKIHLGRRVEGEVSKSAALTIAADGVHSTFRDRLNGPAKPFFTRQIAWRAMIAPAARPDPVATVHMGPCAHVVTYPIQDGDLLNVVAVEERDEWTAADWHLAGDPDEMRSVFGGFGQEVGATLAQVGAVRKWGLFRYPVARTWQAQQPRPQAMIGDAAHPTLPFLAQGANMALEDAWVLADAVDRHGVEDGLPRFQARRRPRVRRAIDAANANARNYHLSGPVTRGLAHAGLSLIGRVAPTLMLRRFDWLYLHDVTTAD